MRQGTKLFTVLFFCLIASAQAAPVKTLFWEDLVPKFETELKDPLASMELYRQLELETIVWAKTLSPQERSAEENKTGVEDAEHYAKQMREQGLDPDQLVEDYWKWRSEAEQRNKQVVPALNGADIKIAGYLLPLEFSETGETQFLLVPYVGACIHTPAPPPNQIVYVELKQSFKVNGPYTPVWVTGKMSTKTSTKALSFVDGSNDIPIGYTLSGSNVELYED